MSYIGASPEGILSRDGLDYQVFDGGLSNYTLAKAVPSAAGVLVFAGGAHQRPDVDYSVSGTTLTPIGGVWNAGTGGVLVFYIGVANVINEPGDKTVTFSKIQDIQSQRILGRGEAGVGSVNEVSIGSGLSLSSGNVLDNPSAFGLPISSTTGTLVANDAGDLIALTAGITVPAGVFSAGQTVSLYNNTAGNLTITQGASLTLRLVGTATTGNRTLAQRGLATVVFISATEAVISGGGLT